MVPSPSNPGLHTHLARDSSCWQDAFGSQMSTSKQDTSAFKTTGNCEFVDETRVSRVFSSRTRHDIFDIFGMRSEDGEDGGRTYLFLCTPYRHPRNPDCTGIRSPLCWSRRCIGRRGDICSSRCTILDTSVRNYDNASNRIVRFLYLRSYRYRFENAYAFSFFFFFEKTCQMYSPCNRLTVVFLILEGKISPYSYTQTFACIRYIGDTVNLFSK